jgi:hypothetical protein
VSLAAVSFSVPSAIAGYRPTPQLGAAVAAAVAAVVSLAASATSCAPAEEPSQFEDLNALPDDVKQAMDAMQVHP